MKGDLEMQNVFLAKKKGETAIRKEEDKIIIF